MRIKNPLRDILAKSGFSRTGKILTALGVGILLLGLITWLAPHAWSQTKQLFAANDQNEDSVSSTTTITVCIDNHWEEQVTTFINRWRTLTSNKVTTLTFDNTLPPECDVAVSHRKYEQNAVSFGTFIGAILTNPESSLPSNIAKQELSSRNVQNFTNYPFPELPISEEEKPSKEIYHLYLPQQISNYINQEQLVRIDGQSIFDKDYPFSLNLYLSALSNTSELKSLSSFLSANFQSADYSSENVVTLAITGKSMIGARGDFTLANSALSSAVSAELKKHNWAILPNQTAITERCSQRSDSNFLCGRPNNLNKFADLFQVVFQYGNSSLHYDYNDFVSTIEQEYPKLDWQTIGASSQPITLQQSQTTVDFTGASLGVKPQNCLGYSNKFPKGLNCLSNLSELKNYFQTEESINLAYVYTDYQQSLSSALAKLPENIDILVLLSTASRHQTSIQTHRTDEKTIIGIAPADFYIINSSEEIKNMSVQQITTVYLYNNEILWIE